VSDGRVVDQDVCFLSTGYSMEKKESYSTITNTIFKAFEKRIMTKSWYPEPEQAYFVAEFLIVDTTRE
jgi:hypothetical protein